MLLDLYIYELYKYYELFFFHVFILCIRITIFQVCMLLFRVLNFVPEEKPEIKFFPVGEDLGRGTERSELIRSNIKPAPDRV